jgi:hypothetical protein
VFSFARSASVRRKRVVIEGFDQSDEDEEEDEVEAALEWPRVGWVFWRRALGCRVGEGVLAARFFGWFGAEGGAVGGLVRALGGGIG